MISSRATIAILCLVLLAIVINDTNAYRLDQRQTHVDNLDDNSDLFQPEFVQKLQKLIAAAGIVYGGNEDRDSTSSGHAIQTRLAINRRPGLIRLKKSE
jgi:hypothetical protein